MSKLFWVKGKVLSGELSCMRKGLADEICQTASDSTATFIHHYLVTGQLVLDKNQYNIALRHQQCAKANSGQKAKKRPTDLLSIISNISGYF